MTRVGTLLMVSLMGIGGTREPSPSILKGKCHFRHCPKLNNGAKMPRRLKHDLSDSGTRTLASCYSGGEAEVALSGGGAGWQLFYSSRTPPAWSSAAATRLSWISSNSSKSVGNMWVLTL
jgi:hypothetical protein